MKRKFEGKVEIIPWESFLGRTYKKPTVSENIAIHFDNHKNAYRYAALIALLLLSIDGTAFADPNIDAKAKSIYYGKLLGFGKWAIIIKGGWDTINKTMREDFDGAKKSFFSYLMVYVFLLALPWSIDQVGGVFDQ